MVERGVPSSRIVGIDISPAMIRKAKELYPEIASCFRVDNMLNPGAFQYGSLTHVTCFYFTVYYLTDPQKRAFFQNAVQWLKPGGYLYIHMADKENIDPVLPSGNPLFMVNPQKYAKRKIKTTKVRFDEFAYVASFNPRDDGSNIVEFNERFTFNDGKVRTNTHLLDMCSTDQMQAKIGRAHV